jgi:hypothetical protein
VAPNGERLLARHRPIVILTFPLWPGVGTSSAGTIDNRRQSPPARLAMSLHIGRSITIDYRSQDGLVLHKRQIPFGEHFRRESRHRRLSPPVPSYENKIHDS